MFRQGFCDSSPSICCSCGDNSANQLTWRLRAGREYRIALDGFRAGIREWAHHARFRNVISRPRDYKRNGSRSANACSTLVPPRTALENSSSPGARFASRRRKLRAAGRAVRESLISTVSGCGDGLATRVAWTMCWMCRRACLSVTKMNQGRIPLFVWNDELR
jgi:hypothetical protein